MILAFSSAKKKNNKQKQKKENKKKVTMKNESLHHILSYMCVGYFDDGYKPNHVGIIHSFLLKKK